ncbi:ABC transporter ATP-binding protein [Virgibacillus sp. MG-45]|uniref:ABC transporter ATP-binding protein n=1 Tax=Virgibacillus sp. MG-45 TaxID=3102791 RepID=UPI002EDA2524
MKKYMVKELYGNIFIIFMLFIVSLLSVLTAVILTFATNSLIDGDLGSFLKWLLIDLVAWALMLIINYGESVYEQKIIQRMCTQIRVDFAKNLEHANFQDFHKLSDGKYISWMTNDLNTIETVGFKNVYAYISSFFSIVLAAIALVNYHYALLIATIVLATVMVFAPNLFTKYIQKATLKLSTANEQLTNKMKNYISGFDVLYFAHKRNQFKQKFLESSRAYAEEKVNYTKTNGKLNNGIGLLNIVCQMIVDLVTGILVIFKQVTFGAISTTGNLASTIFNSLAQLSGQRMQIKSAYSVLEKINDFSKILEEQSRESEKLASLESIELRNLAYAYGDKQVFNNINMTFDRGGKYAIVGESGSGKSTILKIISGQIKSFDGDVVINNKSIKTFNLDELTKLIQYIDQNVFIFEDSVRNNITLWDSYTDNEIYSSLQKANVDFIDDLDSILEENGRNLSGGQKQRIALARSFIQDKKVLLIDEGTSALDKKSAEFIEEMLRNDPSLTVIMVTHRLDIGDYQLFDNVFELENADVVSEAS